MVIQETAYHSMPSILWRIWWWWWWQGNYKNLKYWFSTMKQISPTWRRPWLVHGALESDLIIQSRTILWYKVRTVAVQAGSLMMVVEESSLNENSIESMQEEYHKTCKNTINLKYIPDVKKENWDTLGK